MAERKTSFQEAFNTQTILKLAALAFIGFVFYNANKFGFLYWFDDALITNNQTLIQSSTSDLASIIKSIFSLNSDGSFAPLTMLSLNIDKLIFGFEHPEFWHTHSLLLYLLSCLIVYLIGKEIKMTKTWAILFMLIFALHPMKVETVLLVSARGSVLFGVFYLVFKTLKAYRFTEEHT